MTPEDRIGLGNPAQGLPAPGPTHDEVEKARLRARMVNAVVNTGGADISDEQRRAALLQPMHFERTE